MNFFGNFDIALVSLYVFWIFFAGLIFYLRREDRREGYPLVSEIDGKPIDSGIIYTPNQKVFRMPHGLEDVNAGRIDDYDIKAEPTEPWSGAPLEPTGDPLVDGVGPAAYAFRADRPDVNDHGKPKIVPMRIAKEFGIYKKDPDPRGMDVISGDNQKVGTVTDAWIDSGEAMIRYLEIEIPVTETVTIPAPNVAPPAEGTEQSAPPQPAPEPSPEPQTQTVTKQVSILAPMTLAVIKRKQKQVKIKTLYAKHFENVPKLKNPDQVTLLEEDKITAYYGGGQLYADPKRAEPIL